MEGAKIVFVTGATGRQGGAVVKNLLRNGCNVKALTRNIDSAATLSLRQDNVEIIQGNLNEPATYADHLKQVDGVFAVFDFRQGPKKEVQQGIDLVNAAKENGVRHFLYSSVVGADANTGIPHWESKNRIEEYIKQKGLHYTIIRPASFYENFLIPQVKRRLLKGKLVTPPHKDKVWQYISVEDIGRISAIIFSEPANYIGKTISLAAEQIDGDDTAALFEKVWNRPVKYQQLPEIIVRLAMGRDLFKMFRWINENNALFVKDIDAIKKEFGGMLSLEEWIRTCFK